MSCCRGARPVLLALALLLLLSCGPLPRPFKGGSVENPFDAIQTSAGVVVVPLSGAPPTVAGPLAEILADALRKQDVPATTGSAIKNAFVLEGAAHPPRLAGDPWSIAWVLSRGDGAVVDRLITLHDDNPAIWRDGRTDALTSLARAAAPILAKGLQANLPVAVALQKSTLGVVAVEGAPGDGNDALRKAFDAVLRNAGLPVEGDPEQASVRIFGKVAVSPVPSGRERVKIVWTLRHPDGSEIGVLNQANTIKGGQLDGKWGSLAYDVTFAMVDGVAEMLRVVDNAGKNRRR